MMFPVREQTVIWNTRLSSPSTSVWFYLSIEFWIATGVSCFLSALTVLKSLLPKPPRDITGDVVLVAGAASSLGESLAEEFTKSGCSVIYVDNDLGKLERMTSRLKSRNACVTSTQREVYPPLGIFECNLWDREDIKRLARRVEDEIGPIDILVTCVGTPEQDIFGTVSTTLMSHFWTVLAFLPSLLKRERAHIVGITPVASTHDAYMGSRAAISGLMESLGQELNNRNSRLTFLTVAPKAERSLMRLSEEQVARDVVEAVRRDQRSLSVSWCSKLLYQMSCSIYNVITIITQWVHTQGCDYSI